MKTRKCLHLFNTDAVLFPNVPCLGLVEIFEHLALEHWLYFIDVCTSCVLYLYIYILCVCWERETERREKG